MTIIFMDSPIRSLVLILGTFVITIPNGLLCQRLSDRGSVHASLFHSSWDEALSRSDTISYASTRTSGLGTRAIIILGKAGLGAAFGVVIGIPSAYLTTVISGAEGWSALGPFIIGGTIGYTVGTAVGVHLIALGDNPETSFYGTLLSGLIGFGVGIDVNLSSNDKSFLKAAPLVLPIVFEIIYTELIE